MANGAANELRLVLESQLLRENRAMIFHCALTDVEPSGQPRALILLYWSIGRDILDRQKVEGWGTKVIERLAKDLGTEFPDVEGFSPRNLKYMRAFAEAWPEKEFVQQAIAQLPWGHQTRLLDRIKDRPTRVWYLNAAVEYGWSQNVLVHQISSRLHERQGKALTNFSQALPPEGSDLAVQILTDPYNFDFLTFI
jgi:predicted nuclease of restriction endonuclease-like (RecB) superfamily